VSTRYPQTHTGLSCFPRTHLSNLLIVLSKGLSRKRWQIIASTGWLLLLSSGSFPKTKQPHPRWSYRGIKRFLPSPIVQLVGLLNSIISPPFTYSWHLLIEFHRN
jgi:hypothetical protein